MDLRGLRPLRSLRPLLFALAHATSSCGAEVRGCEQTCPAEGGAAAECSCEGGAGGSTNPGGNGTGAAGGLGGFGASGGVGGSSGTFCEFGELCDASLASECLCFGCNAECTDVEGNGISDCVCGICAPDAYCSDPANCVDNGGCDPFSEGCHCADCSAHPECL